MFRILRRLKNSLKAFLTAPWRRRKLALEAIYELVRARLQTLRATKTYLADLGELGRDPAKPDSNQVDHATEIGHMVATVAKMAPFRAVCLQQAIAVRRMLHRRNIPAKVYLGLSRGADKDPEQQRDAHAWVETGPSVVSGDQELSRFTIVATFG